MCVPVATPGGAARAAEIFVADVVSGSATLTSRLKRTSPNCSFGLRWAANVRAAPRTAAIGRPFML